MITDQKTEQIKEAYLQYKPDMEEVDLNGLQWQKVSQVCLKFPKGARIIDAGCGDGRYMRGLKKYGYGNITGVDLFDSIADKNLDYISGDANNLSFSDTSADVLYAISVINYCQDPFSALKEWNRILKPGGYMVISGHTRYSVFTAIRWFKRRFLSEKFPHLVNMVFHDPVKISRIAASLGLSIEEENGFFISWIDRLFKVRWVSGLLDRILPSPFKFRFGYHFVLVLKKVI